MWEAFCSKISYQELFFNSLTNSKIIDASNDIRPPTVDIFIKTIPRDFCAYIFRGFLRARNSEKITKQRVWIPSALLWTARTYVRISDNERRELKAEETNRNNEEKATPRSPNRSLFVSAWWTAGNRLVFLNGSRWRIFTCEPVALELTDDNRWKKQE